MILEEKTYVDKAEQVIKKLKNGNMITSTKLRNLLAMTADIYNEVWEKGEQEQLPDDICERIDYLRIRFVYESGRDKSVNDFVDEAKILDVLKEIKGSRKRYILFSHYMEALVAFHKYYGGRD